MSTGRLDAVFGALSDPTRRAVLSRLERGEPYGRRACRTVRHVADRVHQAPRHPRERGPHRAAQARPRRAVAGSEPGALEAAHAWLDRHEVVLERAARPPRRVSRAQGERWIHPVDEDTRLVIRRTYDAPVAAVCAAWTDPAQMKHWMGPSDELRTAEVTCDLRVGGRYRIVMHADDGRDAPRRRRVPRDRANRASSSTRGRGRARRSASRSSPSSSRPAGAGHRAPADARTLRRSRRARSSPTRAGTAASTASPAISRTDFHWRLQRWPILSCTASSPPTTSAKAKSFYGKLFDWKFDDMPMPDGTYTMIGVGEGTGGGMMKHPMPDAPSMWMPYVLVDDIKAATRKARDARRQRHARRDRGEGHGMAVDHRRSHRRRPRPVAAKK